MSQSPHLVPPVTRPTYLPTYTLPIFFEAFADCQLFSPTWPCRQKGQVRSNKYRIGYSASTLTIVSTLSPWHRPSDKQHVATPDVGGWPDNVWGPSPIPFSSTYPQVKEMTIEQIKETIEAFGKAAKRAVDAGFDLIEIHGAHGYLITVQTLELPTSSLNPPC